MTIRLNKVTRDLNVGITTAVEFLQKKGFTVEANPNTKITDEQFDLLKKEFSTDKDLKMKSERFIQERQSKERSKASVSIDGYEEETQEKAKPEEIKTVIPEDVRPKFKPVGKIDLDKLGQRSAPVREEEKESEEPEKPTEEKQTEAATVTEMPQSAPSAEVESTADIMSKQEPAKEEEPVEEEGEEEIFKIHQPEIVSKINVIGQIDLAALNQSTRPKKKSKEEKHGRKRKRFVRTRRNR